MASGGPLRDDWHELLAGKDARALTGEPLEMTKAFLAGLHKLAHYMRQTGGPGAPCGRCARGIAILEDPELRARVLPDPTNTLKRRCLRHIAITAPGFSAPLPPSGPG